MASLLRIRAHNFAPHPVSAVFSATGGSGWSVAAYSFLVVAWYSAEETCLYCAGPANYGYDEGFSGLDNELDLDIFNNKTPSAATDTLELTWSAPDGRTPHHYSVYWQLGTSYDLTKPGTKANSADIAPTATSYTLTSPADESTTAEAYIMAFDTPNLTITIYGDHLVSCGPGLMMSVNGGATTEVDSAKYVYDARGINTEITFKTALPPGTASGGTLEFNVGYPTFEIGTEGYYKRVELEPVQQLDPIMRDRFFRNSNGRVCKASLAEKNHVEQLVISIPSTGVSSYEDWAGTLQHWFRSGTTLWIIDQNGDITDSDYGTHPQYIGVITSIDNTGSLGKNARQLFTIVIAVESDEPQGIGTTYDTP